MRNIIVLIIAGITAMPCFFAIAEPLKSAGETGVGTVKEKSIITEERTDSVLKGAIYRAWQRLRSLSPKNKENYADRQLMTATAGIRGAEQTETALKPYWKDDRTQDPEFLRQLEAYNKAQALVDQGRFADANAALDEFIKTYPGSELLPNVWFAKGLSLGADNNMAGASAALKQFVADYPKHPLVDDAKQVIASLQN